MSLASVSASLGRRVSPEAFAPHGPAQRTFLDEALEAARRYEERVTTALSEAVFDRVFPSLVAAIATNDPQADVNSPIWRAQARQTALRLLFHSSSSSTHNSFSMRIINHGKCIILLRKTHNLRQGSQISIHRKHAICNNKNKRRCAVCFWSFLHFLSFV